MKIPSKKFYSLVGDIALDVVGPILESLASQVQDHLNRLGRNEFLLSQRINDLQTVQISMCEDIEAMKEHLEKHDEFLKKV